VVAVVEEVPALELLEVECVVVKVLVEVTANILSASSALIGVFIVMLVEMNVFLELPSLNVVAMEGVVVTVLVMVVEIFS
jgi:hypothetical protein